eukprot:719338_1
MSYAIIFSLIPFILNATIIIHDIWNDDFIMSNHSINGWTHGDNDTYGRRTKYHVWFGKNITRSASLRRQFQCNQYSHIQISFTMCSGCNTQPNYNAFALRSDDKLLHISPDTSYFLSNESALIHPHCHTVFVQDLIVSIANVSVSRLQAFNVEFIPNTTDT